MTENLKTEQNQIVFDHQCPVCTLYSKEAEAVLGQSKTCHLNAREHPVAFSSYQLQEGIVVNIDGVVFQGPDALIEIARRDTRQGLRGRLNRFLFRNRAVAKILYPALKVGRKVLLLLLRRSVSF